MMPAGGEPAGQGAPYSPNRESVNETQEELRPV